MRKVFAAVIIALGLLLGFVASGPVFFASASLFDRPSLLVAMSSLCMMVIVAVAAWGALRVARATRAAAAAVVVGAIAGVVFFVAMTLILLRPPARTLLEPIPGRDVKYWQLPTGSRIAYVKSAAITKHQSTPVIMLHGGPGAPILPMLQLLKDRRPLDPLTGLGYDVYYYDQLGSGFSSRLDLRKEGPYTVARHVADLDAVRTAIGTDRIILVGHSWGAILAARYMIAHPGRVAKVVFDSPGALTGNPGEGMDSRPPSSPEDRARYEHVMQPTLRIGTGRDLAAKNSRAAFYLVADWEVDQWFAAQAAEELRLERLRASCSASVNQSMAETWLAGRSGVGFFCMTNTVQDLLALPDPRPKLRRDGTPALVLRGECDTLAWPSALAYRQTLPNARLTPVTGAGHFIWLDQPEMYGRLLVAFLSDAPLPIADYAGDKRPW